MNTVYRVVWNAALGRWVVASEFARGRRKAGSATMQLAELGVLCMVAVSAPAIAGPGVYINGGVDNTCVLVTDNNASGTLSGTSGPACDPALRASQTTGALFYSSGSGNTDSLTLGNELYVNGGRLILNNRLNGKNSLAIGNELTVSTGWNAIAIGNSSFSTNDQSIAIGAGATADSIQSVIIGRDAGVGSGSVYATTHDNVAVGTRAGQAVTGRNNVALGYQAGVTVNGAGGAGTAGNDNVAVGAGSGNNVSGTSNFGMGWIAGMDVNGNANIAVGAQAGNNVNGSNNNAQGNLAGNSVTGSYNVALGYQAGKGVTGNDNLTIGRTAGSNVTVNRTIAMGVSSLATRDDAIAIGSNARANGVSSISIGTGNTVNGDRSGAFGDPSVINATDSYSVGNNNTIAAGQTDVFALGNNITTTLSNSVNLGSNSAATAAATPSTAGTTVYNSALINGATYSYAGGTAVGVVSVGGVGSERRVQNMASGLVSAGSTDAINGSQLYAVTQGLTHYYSVNDNGVPGANYTNNGAVAVNSLAAGVNASASAGAANGTALGYGATVNVSDGIALGSNAVASTAAGVVGYVPTGATAAQQSAIAATTSTLGAVSVGDASTGQYRQINAVAAGTSDSDAVNVSQLKALNAQVVAGQTHYYSVNDNGVQGTNYTNNGAVAVNSVAAGVNASAGVGADNSVALGYGATASVSDGIALGSNAVASTAAGAVGYVPTGATAAQQSAIAATTSTLGAVSVGDASTGKYRQINAVAAGTADSDAVNVSQLKALNAQVVAGQTHYYSVNDNGVQGANYTNNGATGFNSLAAGVDASTNKANGTALGYGATASAQDGDVALGSGSTTAAVVGTASGTINGTTYAYAGASPTSTVSIGSAGQERTITNVAAGRISASSTDAVNGSQLYATNQAVERLGIQVTNVELKVDNAIGDITNLGNTINELSTGQAGLFQVSPDSTVAPTATGTNSAAGGAGAVASADNSTAIGNGAKATATNSVAIGANSVADRENSVSVGGDGSERQVTHVAAGTAQTDAVNVAQLREANAGAVQYDRHADGSVNYNSVTMSPGGSPAAIHNVAAGTAATDAVNVGQLNDGMNQTRQWSMRYTDDRFRELGRNMDEVDGRASAGVAAAIATASLPQAYQPNQSSAGVALGSFNGEAGIAVGVSTITESGRYIFKANLSTNTRGDTGAGVGAGIVW